MTELSLNILDIANNSVRAEAKNVVISITVKRAENLLKIEIADDGRGMDAELLKRVTDPFSTTRTTRKVGMGIPFFKMAAEMSGGEFRITSEKNKGTVTSASFALGHIDRPPLGDVASTMTTLIGGAENMDFTLNYEKDGEKYVFSTREVKDALSEETLSDADVLNYLRAMIAENIENINGGELI